MDVSTSGGRGILIALAASILLNIALVGVTLWPDSEPTEDVSATAEVTDEAAPDDGEEAEVDDAEPEAEAPKTAAVAEKAPTKKAAAAPGKLSDSEVQVTIASVKGSIPQTLAIAVGQEHASAVSATLSRLLVWDLNLRRDLRAGDRIETAWKLGSSDRVVIESARFHSNKHNKDITAYRFLASGDKYPSYWSADGTEIPHRLRNSPLADYEQITSLLKDRPTHHGMDFKAATGTPVLAAYGGVVTRVNWNWSANGNCIEVRHKDGVLAKYLHLSENKVKAGARVRAGQPIALSGNTGRSTGPHLHYQLNKGKKVVDPIDYHGTDRRTLKKSDRAAFDAFVKASNERLDAGGALAAN